MDLTLGGLFLTGVVFGGCLGILIMAALAARAYERGRLAGCEQAKLDHLADRAAWREAGQRWRQERVQLQQECVELRTRLRLARVRAGGGESRGNGGDDDHAA